VRDGLADVVTMHEVLHTMPYVPLSKNSHGLREQNFARVTSS